MNSLQDKLIELWDRQHPLFPLEFQIQERLLSIIKTKTLFIQQTICWSHDLL